LVGALAGAGVIVGAVLDWFDAGSTNSFQIPAGYLFDKTNSNPDPKLGYFLIGIGLLGILLAFVRNAGFFRFVCGALALMAAILWFVRVGDLISSGSSSTDVTDVVGAGAWVTGISGLILAFSPLVGANSRTGTTTYGARQAS